MWYLPSGRQVSCYTLDAYDYCICLSCIVLSIAYHYDIGLLFLESLKLTSIYCVFDFINVDFIQCVASNIIILLENDTYVYKHIDVGIHIYNMHICI